MIMEMAGIFGWDIDFALDVRKGDSFTVLYEEKFINDKKFSNGHILSAEFINKGKSYKAVLRAPQGLQYRRPESFFCMSGQPVSSAHR